MNIVRYITLCALVAFWQQSSAQQLSEFTPLEREIWLQQEQPLKLRASGGVIYDSNLFRLSEDTDAQAAIGTSNTADTIYRLGAGGKYEVRQSRQTFIAEANFSAYKFQSFSNLDNISDDLRGQWLWQAGNDWNGNLGVGQRRYLENFANIQQNVRDMINQNWIYGSANYLVQSRVKLTLDTSFYDTRHGEETRNVLDSKIGNAAFTVSWVTPALNTVGLQYRTANARFPNEDATTQIENAYRDDELSLVALWIASSASEVTARVGYTERKFDELPNRNFSDPTWRLTYLWQVTGKTALEFATWREISGFEDLSANYVRLTGISVVPTWSITPQMVLRGRVMYWTRNYLGDPGIVPITERREDKDHVYQISALWTPRRLTELVFMVESGRRTSNQAFADYKYGAASILVTRYF